MQGARWRETSAIRTAVRKYIIFPVAGRALRAVRGQDKWESLASAVAHTLVESSTPVGARVVIAEVIRDVGPYLSRDSLDVLQLFEEIARKHSPEAN